jgi:diguanylate cyclase (GGDEF)-like protein
MAFSIFYLVPITLVTVFGSGRLGVAIAAVSGCSYLIAELLSPQPEAVGTVLYWNSFVRLVFFVVSVAMIRFGMAAKSERLLARTDVTTGIANKRAFLEVLRQEVERSKRMKTPLTLACIDIDDFKRLNDEFGHNIGDMALKTAAEIASSSIRAYDTIARIGGDEFALLLPGIEATAAATTLSEFHRMLTTTSMRLGWPVTFSIGALTYLSEPPSASEILHNTDELLYAVKRDGKNNLRHEVRGQGGTER